MDRFKFLLVKNISGKRVLLLFILANLIYVLMLTVTISNVMGFSHGMKLLDMMPTGYDFEYVTALFNTLGQEGRDAYLYQQIPLDMLYPMLFGISFCLVTGYILNRLHQLRKPFLYLCLLPIIAGLFDYLENIGIVTLLINFPQIATNTVKITNIFSIIKSTSTTIYFLALIITLITWGISTIKKK